MATTNCPCFWFLDRIKPNKKFHPHPPFKLLPTPPVLYLHTYLHIRKHSLDIHRRDLHIRISHRILPSPPHRNRNPNSGTNHRTYNHCRLTPSTSDLTDRIDQAQPCKSTANPKPVDHFLQPQTIATWALRLLFASHHQEESNHESRIVVQHQYAGIQRGAVSYHLVLP